MIGLAALGVALLAMVVGIEANTARVERQRRAARERRRRLLDELRRH